MTKPILVTGATGKVGRHLVQILQNSNAVVRAAIHTPDKARALEGANTELVPFDFDDTDSIAQAVRGVDTLALLTPPDARQVDWAIRTIDLAQAAGVRRIVRMSVLAAAMEPGIQLGRWHRTVERYLAESEMEWTILRPGPFMQNFTGMYPATGAGFRLPVGDATVNHIHVADVGCALATVILERGHTGRVYMITGGEPLSFAEATRTLAANTGQSLTYQRVEPDEARFEFLASGRPPWFVDVLLELFGAFNSGAVAMETPTFTQLTGRSPTPFAAFAKEVMHAAAE